MLIVNLCLLLVILQFFKIWSHFIFVWDRRLDRNSLTGPAPANLSALTKLSEMWVAFFYEVYKGIFHCYFMISILLFAIIRFWLLCQNNTISMHFGKSEAMVIWYYRSAHAMDLYLCFQSPNSPFKPLNMISVWKSTWRPSYIIF